MKRVHTALVLQGGAALGAYEAGVLLGLLEPPGRSLDVITGCSIGAVMAAIAAGARGDPREALTDMWQRFSLPGSRYMPAPLVNGLTFLGNWNIYRVNPRYLATPWAATHLYETAPLEQALLEWVDFERLNASATEVVVTAVDVMTGRLAEFSNRNGLTPQHVLASASLPPVFPMQTFDGHAYWDGGLISNTPLRPAINAIESSNHRDGNPPWEVIVVDLFTPRPVPPESLGETFERAFELVFFGKFQHDLKLFETMNAQLDLIRQIDQALPADSPLRQHPAYLKLRRHRQIDRLTVVRTPQPELLGGPADFSIPSIEARIALGRQDAEAQLRSPLRPARPARPRRKAVP